MKSLRGLTIIESGCQDENLNIFYSDYDDGTRIIFRQPRKAGKTELEQKSQRMSGKNNPMYGKSAWNKGLTKETNERVKSASNKLKGRKLNQEWRNKISESRKGKYAGSNHPNWQGGLKENPYGIEFDEMLREKIRERDNRKCVLCGNRDEDRKLQVHHIDYCKTNNDEANLISLCVSCHVETNYNREHWKKFFTDLMFFIYPPLQLITPPFI